MIRGSAVPLAAAALMAGLALAPAARAGAVAPRTAVLFAAPDALAVVGSNLFVANRSANSVTEVSTAHPGTVVRRIAYNVATPVAMVAAGSDVVVVGLGGAVTSFAAATGAKLWSDGGKGYGLSSPDAVSLVGADLFVVDSGGAGAVTELQAASGKLVRIIKGAAYHFSGPSAIVDASAGLFVANRTGNSVTEINPATGAFVRVVSGHFSAPAGITRDSANIWVADSGNNSVTEFVAATGAFERLLNSSEYGLYDPAPIAFGDSHVFVASPPGASPMVTAAKDPSGAFDWMMCNTNPGGYDFSNPRALLVSNGGTLLWVANQGNSSLTEMDAATGAAIAHVS